MSDREMRHQMPVKVEQQGQHRERKRRQPIAPGENQQSGIAHTIQQQNVDQDKLANLKPLQEHNLRRKQHIGYAQEAVGELVERRWVGNVHRQKTLPDRIL